MFKKTKLISILLLAVLFILMFTACHSSVCDDCGKSFSGKGYYIGNVEKTYCETCAADYYYPLPYKSYAKY